jgi:chromosome segregation ATPase
MLDPRFQEVLEFIDELDDDGVPTVRAKIAIKIEAYAQDVATLRTDLSVLEEEVGELQATVNAQSAALAEQADRKIDLVTEAQDAAVRAAMSGGGGGAARLRNEALQTRNRIEEFGKDFDLEASRLAQAETVLNAKNRSVTDMRNSIVRRLNTMSSLADRAGVEFGTEIMEPGAPQTQARPQRAGQQAAPRAVRRRPRRVRVRRRRAS